MLRLSHLSHIPHPLLLCYNCERVTYILARGSVSSMPAIPSQSTINRREEFVLNSAGPGIGYATLIVGYLYTILSTAHLTPLNFVVFSALQVGYIGVVWWFFRMVWHNAEGWQIALGLALLVMITEAVSLLSLIGLQWDWLMFLVTVALSFT